MITDIDENKINIARKLGASHCINASEEGIEKYIGKYICKYGVDAVFESSGVNSAKSDSILAAKAKGTIVLVGTSPDDIVFKGETFELITRKELMLSGCWMSYSDPFPGLEWTTAQKILEHNMIDVKSMVTHRYKLEEVEEAFDMIFGRKESFCKVIIDM